MSSLTPKYLQVMLEHLKAGTVTDAHIENLSRTMEREMPGTWELQVNNARPRLRVPPLTGPLAQVNEAYSRLIISAYGTAVQDAGLALVNPPSGIQVIVYTGGELRADHFFIDRALAQRTVESYLNSAPPYVPHLYGAVITRLGLCAWCGIENQSMLPMRPWFREMPVRFAGILSPQTVELLRRISPGTNFVNTGALWGICDGHPVECQQCGGRIPARITDTAQIDALVINRVCGMCRGSGLTEIQPPKPGLKELRAFGKGFSLKPKRL